MPARSPIRVAAITLAALAATLISLPAAHASTPLATVEGYASQIAGQPVTIECVSGSAMRTGDDGYVLANSNVIYATRAACTAVENVRSQTRHPNGAFFIYDNTRADLKAGPALAIIEHEAMHIALRSSDEGLVECTAFQNRWAFVKQFGLPSWIARMELAGMAWHHSQMHDAAYRTVC